MSELFTFLLINIVKFGKIKSVSMNEEYEYSTIEIVNGNKKITLSVTQEEIKGE